MKILVFVFLIQVNTCFQLNKTESTEKNVSNQKLEALFDHECSECAHNFNDGEIKMGRMVTVLPVIHPIYKLSLEFYVVSTSGASWNNLLHFTKETENGHGPSAVRGPGGAWIPGHGCEHRQFALWVSPIEGDSSHLNTYISACVNGAGSILLPNVGKNRWNSLEIGQYASRTETTDIVHHHYVRLNGEIIHEEVNLMPRTFHDVNVYVSNPWFPAAYGFIRLFRYRKYDNFCLNHCT